MTDLVAAEWLKLRTTRLLHGMLPAAIAISLAAVAGSVLAADRSDIALDSAEGVRRVLPVTGTGAMLLLVAGILVTAGEYRHGTAADTFLTTPRRHRVVAAKLVVGAWIGTAAGMLISICCVGVASVLYRTRGATLPLHDAELWLTLAGTVAYTTLFAVLGVAIGTLVATRYSPSPAPWAGSRSSSTSSSIFSPTSAGGCRPPPARRSSVRLWTDCTRPSPAWVS